MGFSDDHGIVAWWSTMDYVYEFEPSLWLLQCWNTNSFPWISSRASCLFRINWLWAIVPRKVEHLYLFCNCWTYRTCYSIVNLSTIRAFHDLCFVGSEFITLRPGLSHFYVKNSSNQPKYLAYHSSNWNHLVDFLCASFSCSQLHPSSTSYIRLTCSLKLQVVHLFSNNLSTCLVSK